MCCWFDAVRGWADMAFPICCTVYGSASKGRSTVACDHGEGRHGDLPHITNGSDNVEMGYSGLSLEIFLCICPRERSPLAGFSCAVLVVFLNIPYPPRAALTIHRYTCQRNLQQTRRACMGGSTS